MARIIIADDDKIIHKIYAKIIDYLGHEIISCYNGLEVIKAIEDAPADLIILDSQMPEMDGYEACQAVRKLPDGITIPIIIVSADDSQDAILRFSNAGANDYILKPISETILIAKLKTFLKTASLHKNELEIVREKVVIADQYKIEKVLGYGAHSVVFLAQDNKNNNRKVAIKLLNKNVLSDDLIAVITDLTLKLQKADLKNVIKIYDFGQYADSIYMVLEYADGGDLAKKIKQYGTIAESEIVKIGTDITDALSSLEKYDILHLDIKPENIMIHEGVYKLSDFGIVYQRSTSTMPLNAEIWGTPAYSSPEILMDDVNVSVKSDIYSFGIVLYECLTGDNPFMSEKPSVSMSRQLNLHPTSLLELGGEISVEISILVDMMLDKIPDQRPFLDTLIKTFSYINDCINNPSSKQLTYQQIITKSILSKPSLKVVEKAKRQINDVVKDVSTSAKVSLHTQRWEKGLPFKVPKIKSRHKSLKVKPIFLKTAIAIVVFIVLYICTLFVQTLFTRAEKKYDFKGTPSVVICEECGNLEKKPVIDIWDSKCSKCGQQDWYAVKCGKCQKNYPLNESEFDDEDLSDEDFELELDEDYACPFCKSNVPAKDNSKIKDKK